MKTPSERRAKAPRPTNEYRGHRVGSELAAVDDLSAFDAIIAARQPVRLLAGVPIDVEKFDLDAIVDTLHYSEPLQVERKHGGGFGLGRERERMTLAQIVAKLRTDDSYYLTTQYESDQEENGEDEEEDDEEEDGEGGFALAEFSDALVDFSLDHDDFDDCESEPDEPDETGRRESQTNGTKGTMSNGAEAKGDGNTDVDEADADTDAEVDAEVDAHPDADADAEGSDADDANAESGEGSAESDFEDDFDNDLESGDNALRGDALEDDAGDDDYRVRTLFQPPLTNLATDASFPLCPPPFANLIPQQVNLWMGSSAQNPKPDLLHPTTQGLGRYVPSGNSSGLHHDHADNLYVLVRGRKRFTLYSPADALGLFTVGTVNKVYANGLIDYVVDKRAPRWRPMREDGAIVAEHARWLLDRKDFSAHSRQALEYIVANEPAYTGPVDPALDPPSFSSVPPVLAHLDEVDDPAEVEALRTYAEKHFPGFLRLRKYEVWLGPGDMLYIPTGWFHEVTSYAGSGPGHIALNWWFVPPVCTDGAAAYPDQYWREDFEICRAAVRRKKEKSMSGREV